MSLSLWESGGLAPVQDHRHHSSTLDSLKTVPEAQRDPSHTPQPVVGLHEFRPVFFPQILLDY